MTTDRKIVLIGPMGAGKTSLGKRLAARLRWDFVDTDLAVALRQLITKHTRQPKRIYCSYTAMLALRRLLARYTDVEEIR